MIRLRWEYVKNRKRYLSGVGFTCDPISDSVLYQLLDTLTAGLKEGKFDKYLTVIEDGGDMIATSFSQDPDMKFALWTDRGDWISTSWPFFVTKVSVVSIVFCDKYEFKIEAEYLENGNQEPIKTVSGPVGLKDFYLELLKRIPTIERIKAARVGNTIMGKIEES
jgi:hypothetical protein